LRHDKLAIDNLVFNIIDKLVFNIIMARPILKGIIKIKSKSGHIDLSQMSDKNMLHVHIMYYI